MDIDFSWMDEISSQAATDQRDQSQPSKSEDTGELVRLDREKEEYNKLLEANKLFQKNIKESEALQTELLKGLDAGEAVETLLLKACKAIALMTNNNSFYDHIEADLVTIYGEGLLKPIPLETELEAVRSRLKSLEDALERNILGSDKSRIERAIKAHRERLEALQGLIDKAAK